MRPVNLIPPEDRRGEKAPLRTGPLAYMIVGALALALVGVTLVVLTNNRISDREAQKANLEGQVQQAQADAEKLQPFVNFASLQDARQATVASLAKSRFDWERTLRELAIVIPPDVWLTNLDAAASGGASSTSSSTTSSSTATVEGPSLDISGCAAGHEAVAGFLAALRDIDGVTRATVMSSERANDSGTSDGSSSSTSTGSTGAGCASRDFIATFDVVVAFDAAQPAAAPDSTSSASTATTTTTAPSESVPSSADSESDQAQASANDAGTFAAGTGSTP